MANRPRLTPAMRKLALLDKGQGFDKARDTIRNFGLATHIRARGEEAKARIWEAGVKARDRVAE